MRNKGFTLIEMLITLLILSLVVLSGAYAYQYMADNWQRNKKIYAHQNVQYKNWLRITNALSNIAPKMVKTDEAQSGYYFLGRENGFTGYAFSSVQNPGVPSVFRLFRERSETNSGWQLVYEEAPLQSEVLSHSDQTLPFNFRVVILEQADIIEFEYFGWASRKARAGSTDVFAGELETPKWFPRYDGIARGQHPLVIQVIIDDFLWPFVVPDTTLGLDKNVSPTEI